MIKKALCIILALSTLLLGGCWNNRDLDELGVVTAIGVDQAPNGYVALTYQVITLAQTSSTGSSSGTNAGSGSTLTVSSQGKTMFDAARNMIPKLGKKAYLSQMQLLVIGQKAAVQGFENTWDFFERDHEPSRVFRIIVAKNSTAKSIITAQCGDEDISAVEIADSITNDSLGKNVSIQAFSISDLLAQPLTGIVTGVIDPNHSNNLTDMKVSGGAVFKNARLVGFLGEDETRGYLFGSNKIKSTILIIANPEESRNRVSIELIGSKSKLTAKLENGKPKLGIQIKAFGNIGEEQGYTNLSNLVDIKKMEQEASALIAENIRKMLAKAQKRLDSDILNFNSILYKHQYGDFEKIKGDWNKLYREATISIQVQFTIRRSGIITKPAYE